MRKITISQLNELTEKARNSERLRMNYNFHRQLSDILQRMLNAMEPETYVQPHKHEDPDKREAFIILRGKILTVQFDSEGNITDHIILDRDAGYFGVEIEPGVYHTLISLEPGSVVYEVKDGPYNPIDDKNFAGWAPKEGTPGCREYIQKVLKQLDLKNY